ncbi:hypothetical protein K7X08_030513 [Anisodus acutangulus]|uniref:Replication factor A C-terminal domain-containing protein n=1 Tax=Anisodus acutangulus TaxID=402998 RepID=A0A9Q1MRK6_9SOLA|nr:hypothetical protein K7X08_030513 [Anisodus acutangulus]
MPINLTANAISAINAGDVNSNPVVQVLDIKLIGTTQERYRLTLSDFESTQQAMLATQLNDRVKTGRVRKTSVIRLIEYICSTVQNRKIIVVLNMETIIPECEIIGNPNITVESNSGAQKTISNGASGSAILSNNGNLSAQRSGQASFANSSKFRQCNKKVTRSGNSRWQCDRCNQEFEECDYRYLLQAQIQDHTGLTWMTSFQESGEEILGCPAKELYMMKYEEADDTRFSEIIRNCLFRQFMFRLKIKEEFYGDEQRVKITVVKAEKVNHSAESRHLLDLISKFRHC